MLSLTSHNLSFSSEHLRGADSKPPLREVAQPLLGLLSNDLALLRAKASTDSASLFRAEIERGVLLVLVEEAELLALGCVDDGQGASNCLADVVASRVRLVGVFVRYCC